MKHYTNIAALAKDTQTSRMLQHDNATRRYHTMKPHHKATRWVAIHSFLFTNGRNRQLSPSPKDSHVSYSHGGGGGVDSAESNIPLPSRKETALHFPLQTTDSGTLVKRKKNEEEDSLKKLFFDIFRNSRASFNSYFVFLHSLTKASHWCKPQRVVVVVQKQKGPNKRLKCY